MKLPNKMYELYRNYLPDILLVITIIALIFYASNIPYINLIIISLDPLLTSVVAVWIIFYLLKAPSAKQTMIWALILFVVNYPLVLAHKEKIAELFASLSFAMIFTAAIVELIRLKKSLKKNLVDTNS